VGFRASAIYRAAWQHFFQGRAVASDVRFRWSARHVMVRSSGVTSWSASCTILTDVRHSSPMPWMHFPTHTGNQLRCSSRKTASVSATVRPKVMATSTATPESTPEELGLYSIMCLLEATLAQVGVAFSWVLHHGIPRSGNDGIAHLGQGIGSTSR